MCSPLCDTCSYLYTCGNSKVSEPRLNIGTSGLFEWHPPSAVECLNESRTLSVLGFDCGLHLKRNIGDDFFDWEKLDAMPEFCLA
jgi:hypothetical protein